MSSIWGTSFNDYRKLALAYEKFNSGQGSVYKGHHNRKEFYVGSVMFANLNSPVYRFVRTPDNKLVKLIKNQEINVVHENQSFNVHKIFVPVPDIGVYSRFDGDTIPLEALHGRLQFLFLEQASRYFDEYVYGMTAPSIIKLQTRDWGPSTVLQLHYDRWKTYSYMFDLNWPEMPQEFMDRVAAYENDKIGKYTDPANIKKRDISRVRAKARKEAKEAFGV